VFRGEFRSLQVGAFWCGLLFLGGCSGVIGGSHGGGPAQDGSSSSEPSASNVASLFACESPGPQPSEARLVRLSGSQFARAVDVLRRGRSANANRDRDGNAVPSPFQAPNSADRFTTVASSYFIGEGETSTVLQSASSVAVEVASDLVRAGASCAADGFDEDCARSLIAEKGALLLGRELDADELDTYVGLATDSRVSVLGTETALATTMEALLSSPSFLFRTELGEPAGGGTFKLTSYEIASALSYTLTDGPPDEELWRAAVEGRLTEPTEIEAQVQRLLSPLDQSDALARFIREYFRYDEAESVAKELQDFPFHDAESLQEDTSLFVREALKRSGETSLLETLLTADWGFVRAATTESYNFSGSMPQDGTPELIAFGSDKRTGIMTQPSWLVAFSQIDHNDAIRRGKFIRESLLCGSIPAIDISMVSPLDLSEDKTMRESLEQHRTDPSCAGCHSLMDPLGLAFAAFDHVGRERDMEAGRAVDESGELTGTGDQDGPFDGVSDLMWKLAASETVRQCLVVHAYEYFRGARRGQADGCALQEADDALKAADGNLVALISEFFASDEFVIRIPAEGQ